MLIQTKITYPDKNPLQTVTNFKKSFVAIEG